MCIFPKTILKKTIAFGEGLETPLGEGIPIEAERKLE